VFDKIISVDGIAIQSSIWVAGAGRSLTNLFGTGHSGNLAPYSDFVHLS
jgi:hypothetical protein